MKGQGIRWKEGGERIRRRRTKDGGQRSWERKRKEDFIETIGVEKLVMGRQ